MATEAQRLIGVSLTKIAKSRGRGGANLHKNLLVATVLQKARYVFMEEAYCMARENFVTSEQTEFQKDTMEMIESTPDEVTDTAEFFISPVLPGSEVVDRLQYNFEEETGSPQFDSETPTTGVKRCCDDASPISKRHCTSSDTCHIVGPCLCPIVNFDSNPAVSLTLTFVNPEQHVLSELSLEQSYSNHLTSVSQRTVVAV